MASGYAMNEEVIMIHPRHSEWQGPAVFIRDLDFWETNNNEPGCLVAVYLHNKLKAYRRISPYYLKPTGICGDCSGPRHPWTEDYLCVACRAQRNHADECRA